MLSLRPCKAEHCTRPLCIKLSATKHCPVTTIKTRKFLVTGLGKKQGRSTLGQEWDESCIKILSPGLSKSGFSAFMEKECQRRTKQEIPARPGDPGSSQWKTTLLRARHIWGRWAHGNPPLLKRLAERWQPTRETNDPEGMWANLTNWEICSSTNRKEWPEVL